MINYKYIIDGVDDFTTESGVKRSNFCNFYCNASIKKKQKRNLKKSVKIIQPFKKQ